MRSSIALVALTLAGCAAETSSPAVADHFEVVQAPATGIPGRPLDSLLIVRLVDERGAPLAGVEVRWSVDPGSGTIAPTSSTTQHDGTASAVWTLGLGGDDQSVRVGLPGVPTLRIGIAIDGVRAVQLALGSGFACILDSVGDASCWGSMGDGWHDFGPAPVKVDSGHALLELTAGAYSACGRAAATTYCWGVASDVGRGNPTTSTYLGSGPVGGGMTFTDISTKDYTTCGIDVAGQAWCWGRDIRGNLGNIAFYGISSPSPTPVQQSGQVFVKISAGYSHTCALEGDGTAWCWGDNAQGASGDTLAGGWTTIPHRVSTDLRFTEISTGQYNTCASTLSGALWCWGDDPPAVPRVTFSSRPVAVTGGPFQSLELDYGGGTALMHGRPVFWHNPLGFDARVAGWSSAAPSEIPGGAYAIRELHLYYGTVCGIRNDDLVLCWGAVPGMSDPWSHMALDGPVAIPAP